MKILTYNDMDFSCLQKPDNPSALVYTACRTTMFSKEVSNYDSEGLLKFLVNAEHTSILEHVVFTFKIARVSRSFMAQITRHRMGSFSIASQHYNDYRDMPVVVHPKYKKYFDQYYMFDDLIKHYIELIDDYEVPNHEARQVLPNASAVEMVWTVNARSLLNFFRQRCCNRNTAEINLFANRLREYILAIWPGFGKLCGPPCFTDKKCNQGKMQCKEGVWTNVLYLSK